MGIENALGYLGAAHGIAAVDPSSVDQVLAKPCRGIMVGVQGNVGVIMADGSSAVLLALNPGSIYPIAATTILHTGTTATGIIVLF